MHIDALMQYHTLNTCAKCGLLSSRIARVIAYISITIGLSQRRRVDLKLSTGAFWIISLQSWDDKLTVVLIDVKISIVCCKEFNVPLAAYHNTLE